MIEKLGDPNLDASGLPPLAHANVLASRQPQNMDNAIVGALTKLAEVAELIDVDEVIRDINEDREVAGIPKVTDRDVVDQEISARHRTYCDYAKGLLDDLPSTRLVRIVNEVTDLGASGDTDHRLVRDLVGVYEVACQGFIDGETKNVDALLARILVQTADGNGSIIDTLNSLRDVLDNFVTVIRPVQLMSRAKGIDHPGSKNLAYNIRSVALDLHNIHNLSEISNELTKILKEKFGLLTEFAEHVGQDADTLKDILEARREAAEDEHKWKQSLAYSADIGAVFPEKLHLSAEHGVSWQGQTIRFEDILTLRWGGTRHSINGIPTGTTFDICIGSGNGSTTIRTRKQDVFSEIVDRLWRGAGVRIAMDYARQVKRGAVLRFPNLVIEDHGLVITRKRMFKKDEDVRLSWDKVKIWDANGSFCVGDRNDSSIHVELSFLGQPNAVVLANMMRAFWKSNSPNFGSLAD